MRSRALVLVAALLLVAADAKEEKDLDKLKGTWVPVSRAVDGKAMTAQELKTVKLTVAGDKSTYTQEGKSSTGTYKLDPTQKPKTIDIVLTDGPDKGKTWLGIYEFDGANWKVCFDPSGKNRPKEFAGKPGVVLEVWSR